MNETPPVESAVRTHDVRVRYARRGREPHPALRGVTLDTDSDDGVVALLGPNASGKSTLIKVICGLLKPDQGDVSVFGTSDLARIRAMISVVFQANSLDPHLTVDENLRCQAALYGIRSSEATERIEHELERAELMDRRTSLVRELSLGLARRVDLVRALLHRPRLLLLDEPTVGLDPVARNAFLDQLAARRIADGFTMIMTTHLIDEADRADRVIFMHEGMIVADGEPEELRRKRGGAIITVHERRQPTVSIGNTAWESWQGQWRGVSAGPREETHAVVTALLKNGTPFSVANPTLGDVFEYVTGATLENGHVS